MKLLYKSVRLVSWVFGVCALFALLAVLSLVGGVFLLALTLGAM